MTDQELLKFIQSFPNSPEAHAYRLGLKNKSLELAPFIEKLVNSLPVEVKE